MVTITYGTVKSHVSSDDPLERKAVFTILDSRLSYYKPGYFFSPAYSMGVWDGKVHFFSVTTGLLYSGFITRALQILHKEGVPYDLIGYPQSLPSDGDTSPIVLPDGLTLYEHQSHAVRQVRRFSRGVIQIAPNGGKTEVAAAVIDSYGIPPTVYYVPRALLVDQVASRLEKRLLIKVGRVGAGFNMPNPSGVTVAMTHLTSQRIKSLAKAKAREKHQYDISYVTKSEININDECHMMSDARYQVCVEKSPAPIRVLMSATPFRKDEVERAFVQGYGGPLLAVVGNDELIEKGISAKPNVMFLEPKISVVKQAEYRLMDYRYALSECVERNQTIAAIGRAFVACGLQILIMVTRVEHAKEISRWIPEATLTHGSASNRKVTEKKIRDGKVFCCISTAILDTGLDTPHIGGLVYAGGGSDQIRLEQTLGRILRQNESKDKSPWFFDFHDSYHPVLKRHARVRHKFFLRHSNFNMAEDFACLPPEVYNRFMKEISFIGGIHGK